MLDSASRRRRFSRTCLAAASFVLVLCAGIAPGALAADPAAPSDVAPVAAPRPAGTALLYFFSPDWRPLDLGKLTATMEGAFAAGGVPISFQAFTRYEDFERQVADAPPESLIAPAWLADRPAFAPGLSLTVIAYPLHHGKSTYRKALMTRPGIDSIDDLARGSIAATVHSMSNGSSDAVLGAFHLAVDSARVVPVPKDVDALLALSFGQVDAALVTSQQYQELARTSPAEAERLRVLAFSPEVGLPPAFASAKADPSLSARLRDLLLRLPEVPEGASVLAMLGFDGFVAEPPKAPPSTGPAAEAPATQAAAPLPERSAVPAPSTKHHPAKTANVVRPRSARAHRN